MMANDFLILTDKIILGSSSPGPCYVYSTDPFTILELQNQSHDVPELNEIDLFSGLDPLKLRKGRSGS